MIIPLDDNSNIVSKIFNHRSAIAEVYSYDTLDRVTAGDYHESNPARPDEGYEYDKLGNRTTLRNDGAVTTQYTHNPANEYLTVGGTNVYYDAAGNLTKDHRGLNGYRYDYDHDNRLIHIRDSTNGTVTKATYTYDALGRRIESVIGSTTTQYYYDGQRVLLDTDGSGVDQRYYVWGNYIDEALMMKKLVGDNQGDYYYGHDHLYSVSVLFASNGTVSERYEYDAYGKMYRLNENFTDFSGTEAGNPYYFTGRELDSIDSNALKIMYYRARYYDPTTGRFLQRDPIGIEPSRIQINWFSPIRQYLIDRNLYSYVKSQPGTLRDPYGLDPVGPDPDCDWPPMRRKPRTDKECCIIKLLSVHF